MAARQQLFSMDETTEEAIDRRLSASTLDIISTMLEAQLGQQSTNAQMGRRLDEVKGYILAACTTATSTWKRSLGIHPLHPARFIVVSHATRPHRCSGFGNSVWPPVTVFSARQGSVG
ncbi:hypothetical protein AGR5A_pb0019 [Agrobacterium genomosp. 5 str. CFBP 6626]|nr:hypothetical protein AGR5A_pb0019 [Agrobacterium genomosp. 5 str. CFBP 6626]